MRVVVSTGGECPRRGETVRRKLAESAALVVAADGGLRHLVLVDHRPDVLIGDLDSVDAVLVGALRGEGTEVIVHPEAKDETDFELAMNVAIDRGATQIIVMGVFGGRVDHELANLALIADRRWYRDHGCRVGAYDGVRSVWPVHDSWTLAEPPGRTISLVPWGGDAEGVTTSGLRYALYDETLPLGSPRGMSNVADAATQRVQVRKGTLLMIVDNSEEPE